MKTCGVCSGDSLPTRISRVSPPALANNFGSPYFTGKRCVDPLNEVSDIPVSIRLRFITVILLFISSRMRVFNLGRRTQMTGLLLVVYYSIERKVYPPSQQLRIVPIPTTCGPATNVFSVAN